MILTGHEIRACIDRGAIRIMPFRQERLNPNSYNMTLASVLKMYRDPVLSTKIENHTEDLCIPEAGLLLTPGRLYLGSTVEWTETPYHAPMIEGRSSIGRLGLSVHVTAGFGDIGFKGTWTLEMTVVQPLRIYAGLEICQICFIKPLGKIAERYDGRYQGQREPQASRLHIETR